MLAACQRSPDKSVRAFDEPRITPATVASMAPVPLATKNVPMDSVEQYCSIGLQPSKDPKLDVQRFGAVCGASTGLVPLTPVFTKELSTPGAVTAHRLEPAECVRAIAASSSDELVDLEWKVRDRVLARCSIEGLGACPENGALCPYLGDDEKTSDVELFLSNPLDVEVTLAVWRRKDP
jgi:hypothetical protein